MRAAQVIRLVLWAIFLVLLQVLVLDHLEINNLIYPQVYILVLIGLPINMDRRLAYLSGFVLGLIVDSFLYVPGLHAASCTALMYLRQLYFRNFAEQEWYDNGIRPGINTPETAWYLVYVSVFSLLFHTILFFLEAFSFQHAEITLLRILLSSSVSVLLILLLEYVTDSPRRV